MNSTRTIASDPTGDLVVTVTKTATVEWAPPRSRITLELIAAADPDLLWVSMGRVFLGVTLSGAEVVYRVTAWVPPGALALERVEPPLTAEERGQMAALDSQASTSPAPEAS
jgi:hypothetical protein